MVLVSSGEQITSLIFLTYAAPQVSETLFYFFFFPLCPHHTFSQMLKQDGEALCSDSSDSLPLCSTAA